MNILLHWQVGVGVYQWRRHPSAEFEDVLVLGHGPGQPLIAFRFFHDQPFFISSLKGEWIKKQ